MTVIRLAVTLACLGAAAPSTASDAAVKMTFGEALEAAHETPRLNRLAAEVEAAEASLVTAATYPYNPEIEIEAADRRGPTGSSTDGAVGVSQRFELSGQRGKRRSAAKASLAAARASFAQARVGLLADAALAFAEAVQRRNLLTIEETEAELARAFAATVERRLEAGSATAIDLALAQAGLSRAERGLALATGSYRAAQARLAESVGSPDAALVAPAGDLPILAPPPSLDDVLSRAVVGRGDLAAAAARVEAAAARRQLARAARFPHLTVAARASREEGDEITGLAITLPLPFFDRNEGGLAEAEAEISAARSELATAELVLRREVTAAHGRLTAAIAAQQMTERLGVTPLEEGLALLEHAFEAGKIGSAELLLYRRELVEGRRQAFAASTDVWEATIDLAVAAGGTFTGMDWLEQETAR